MRYFECARPMNQLSRVETRRRVRAFRSRLGRCAPLVFFAGSRAAVTCSNAESADTDEGVLRWVKAASVRITATMTRTIHQTLPSDEALATLMAKRVMRIDAIQNPFAQPIARGERAAEPEDLEKMEKTPHDPDPPPAWARGLFSALSN